MIPARPAPTRRMLDSSSLIAEETADCTEEKEEGGYRGAEGVTYGYGGAEGEAPL